MSPPAHAKHSTTSTLPMLYANPATTPVSPAPPLSPAPPAHPLSTALSPPSATASLGTCKTQPVPATQPACYATRSAKHAHHPRTTASPAIQPLAIYRQTQATPPKTHAYAT
jgi:hypothetical protein